MNYIKRRLCEASTWAGLAGAGAAAATAYGGRGAMVTAAVLAGLVAVLVPEKQAGKAGE